MNGLALVLNIFIPGVGSFVVGKAGQGIGQILLWGIGFFLTLTGILSIFGLPMMLGAWIWGIITVVGGKGQQAMTVNVVQQVGPSNSVVSPDQNSN